MQAVRLSAHHASYYILRLPRDGLCPEALLYIPGQPHSCTVVWGAAKAGFPDDGDGYILGVTLAGWFERHDCPNQDVKVLYRKVSLDGMDAAVLDRDSPIATGIFMPRLKGIGHNDEWRKKVLLYYPEMPVLEALALAGINPAVLGKERLPRLKETWTFLMPAYRLNRRGNAFKLGREQPPAEMISRESYPHIIHMLSTLFALVIHIA